MKRYRFAKAIVTAIFAILFITFATPEISAQTPVTITKEKVRVSGKLMYAHKVAKGQTIYSICKAYNVTAEELQEFNPALSSGLKEGMLLVIPIAEEKNNSQKSEKKSAAEILAERAAEGKDVIKEGAVSIAEKAKDFGTKVAEKAKEITGGKKEKVVESGKEIGEKVSEKAVEVAEKVEEQKDKIVQKGKEVKEVIVGEKKEEEVKEEVKEVAKENVKENSEDIVNTVAKGAVQEGDTYKTHNVKWYEDLDEIADQYNINKELIRYYNSLASDNLDKVETLKIPTDKTLERVKQEYVKSLYSKPSTESTNNEVAQPTAQSARKTLPSRELQSSNEPSSREFQATSENANLNISVILPLHSNNKISATYMDFYTGVLLAAEQLNKRGIYKFNIIDQSEYSTNQAVILDNNLKESDVILGPVRSKDIANYIDFINDNRIPLISPLDPSSESLLDKSNYLFQVPISKEIQDKALVNWIAESYKYLQTPLVTVIWEEGGSSVKEAENLMTLLTANNIEYSTISFPITKSVQIGSTFKKVLDGDKNNLAIVVSNNEGFVAEALRNLDALNYMPDNITVFGNNKWRSFENIDLNLLFKYSTRIVTPYFVDLSDQDVKEFIIKYRETFNAEPSANAFCGYDILTTYLPVAKALWLSENNNERLGSYIATKGLQQYYVVDKSNPDANEDEMSGYKNYGATGIIYNTNYTITSTPLNAYK